MPDITLSGNIVLNPDDTKIYLLYRKDHLFYETPGGKVKPEECINFNAPTLLELKTTAKRELLEELSGIIEIVSMEYFDAVKFKVPDGREAIAHKFIVRVRGELCPKEDIFDPKKSGWLSIKTLERYSLSPDLKQLLPSLKSYVKK